ncbi:hypothetical protein GT347_15835 [Xylophilus rhododendri]|uniref:Uncharacterized protein n=1 Tax=Xylophilus rhododendri TaxID=2697032 RepID=A0A857J6G3_9BURK|nr:hypothetical protein [Xylophilus rhododendri]QHI99317.1 hypothetical protein GT347_15835 [Xylophilus rhododendri]
MHITSASQGSGSIHPPQPLSFEALPNELKQTIADDILNRLLWQPEAGGPEVFVGNAALAAQLARQVAASAAIKALWVAADVPSFRRAVDAIDSAPQEYKSQCWQAAWHALMAFASANAKAPVVEAMLAHMLEHLPENPALRLRQLRRATAFLQRKAGVGWSLSSATTILRRCAEYPDLSPGLWHRLLELQLLHMSYHPSAYRHWRIAMTAGLAAAQFSQLTLLGDCVRRDPVEPTPRALRGLLARIERIADPAIRLTLFGVLESRAMWQRRLRPEFADVQREVHQAMLKLTDPALRPRVLEIVPFQEGHAERDTLLQELAAMPPLAAMAVLDRQFLNFAPDAEGMDLLRQCVDALLERSRNAAETHPALLHKLAIASRQLGDEALRLHIAARVLQESAALGAADRLTVLTIRHTASWPGDALRPDWESAQRAALAATSDLLRQAKAACAARPLMLAMTNALGLQDSRDAVLQAQRAALSLFEPERQAELLDDIAFQCVVDPLAMEEEHTLQLIEDCGRLPFYLRPRLLDTLGYLCSDPESPGATQLAALQQRTRQERQAWIDLPPPGGIARPSSHGEPPCR